MIGYLRGVIISKHRDEIILDVNGVGYKVFVTTEYKLSEKIEIFIYTHVREDTLSLYGFSESDALDLFKLLIGVSGIGPKVALSIIKSTSVDRVKSAISKADVAFFTAIPGIGKKGAQKIIIDLKNKMGSLGELDLTDDTQNDIVDSLVAMGFDKKAVQREIVKIDSKLSDKQKIKIALEKLSKK